MGSRIASHAGTANDSVNIWGIVMNCEISYVNVIRFSQTTITDISMGVPSTQERRIDRHVGTDNDSVNHLRYRREFWNKLC